MEAVFAHLIEAVADIESSAIAERNDQEAKGLFQLACQLRANELAGTTRVIGGDHFDDRAFEEAWEQFRTLHRPPTPKPGAG